MPPEEGDNQALAVNTTDDTVVYDLAFAMIWVDGDEPVTNTNEAYAAASCENCAAVAVSFQVVLIVGDADTVVPANLATAVNYNCVQCLTYALASQLVVTLDGPLSDAGMAALQDLWAEIADYARGITGRSLSELQGALEDFQDQILEVIDNDPSRAPDDDPTTTEPSESPSAEPSESPRAVGGAERGAVGAAQRVPERGAQRVAAGLVDAERDGRPVDEPVARAVVVRGGADDGLAVTPPVLTSGPGQGTVDDFW